MIKVITGKKGTGKTKILVDMINKAAKETKGNVVCIDKGAKLTYDIDHSVRLTNAEEFCIDGYDKFYGFVAGMLAGNFDISQIYVDAILRICGRDYKAAGELFEKLDKISGSEVEIVFTVSADKSELPENVLKYI